MPSPEQIKRPSYAITSVDHALRLIQMLRDEGSVRVSDAATELDVAPSTIHRLLAMLVYRGFAIKDDGRGYAPGPALGAPPAMVPWTRTLRTACRPHLELLSMRLNETVNLLIRVGGKVRFLESVESSNILRIGDRTGTVLEARAASGGKALLAEADASTLHRLYRSTAAEFAGDLLSEQTYHRLLRELEEVNVTGFARNIEETESGVCAIGLSLHNGEGLPIASFSIAVPRSRASTLTEPSVISLALETRGEIDVDLASVTSLVERG
ncbi:IclR family transcriptional regulator [Subtercola boreus]|uniref:IclR family transcriptional regulator n=1 Tax=Subtercola boreus TaxID=120213 RepID=A0A3E0VN82_9MICO|nr:IclR family transcriptional regulator C-terminal domain-containing protein [Subtercola boreus]RFA10873.1 IclR family transcriptional regulator [Subtercola boreus]TQL55544.1 IclR family transcriptional regulator [Subtercola boreus]